MESVGAILGLWGVAWVLWDTLARVPGYMLGAGVFLLIIGTATEAPAAEPPCPPKRFYCWEVKAAVAVWGEQAMRARAKACGWPESKIEAAAKCLRGSS